MVVCFCFEYRAVVYSSGDEISLLQCSTCEQWFHLHCTGRAVDDNCSLYSCDDCSARNRHTISGAKATMNRRLEPVITPRQKDDTADKLDIGQCGTRLPVVSNSCKLVNKSQPCGPNDNDVDDDVIVID